MGLPSRNASTVDPAGPLKVTCAVGLVVSREMKVGVSSSTGSVDIVATEASPLRVWCAVKLTVPSRPGTASGVANQLPAASTRAVATSVRPSNRWTTAPGTPVPLSSGRNKPRFSVEVIAGAARVSVGFVVGAAVGGAVVWPGVACGVGAGV